MPQVAGLCLQEKSGTRSFLLRRCPFLSDQKGTKESPGVGSEERQRSSRPPPDPRYGRRFPGNCSSHPARVVQSIAPLPRRCRWLGNFERVIRLDGESAPGASSRRGWSKLSGGGTPPLRKACVLRCRGGLWPPAVYHPAKQHGTGQAAPVGTSMPQPLPRQGPVARKEGHTPLRICPPEETNRQRYPTKNGVLVPLPPWAKEPAAGAAESSPKKLP